MSSERTTELKGSLTMPTWFNYAMMATILYGLHQVFTKIAAEKISDGLSGFIVEASATLTNRQ